jgi:hypothetical protein
MKHSHKKPKAMFQSAVSKEANALQLISRKPNNFFLWEERQTIFLAQLKMVLSKENTSSINKMKRRL